MPFLCRSALVTLCGLLTLFFASLIILLAIIYLQSSSGAKTASSSPSHCQPQPSPVDFALPLWKIPFDFVDYELLGHRYAENDCCEYEIAQT